MVQWIWSDNGSSFGAGSDFFAGSAEFRSNVGFFFFLFTTCYYMYSYERLFRVFHFFFLINRTGLFSSLAGCDDVAVWSLLHFEGKSEGILGLPGRPT